MCANIYSNAYRNKKRGRQNLDDIEKNNNMEAYELGAPPVPVRTCSAPARLRGACSTNNMTELSPTKVSLGLLS